MREYETNISRRDFLRFLGTVLIGAVACRPSESQQSVQTGLEFKQSDHKVWTAPYWYPLSESLARRTNTPFLHSENGPLHTFDKIYRNITGEFSDARGWAQYFANESIKNNPGWENWMGYCHGLANAIAQESEPIGETREIEQVLVDRIDTVGILTALHASDPSYYYFEQKDWINAVIQDFIKKGRPFVVNIPEGEEGRWFRTVYAASTDGRFLKTTDINKGYRTFLSSSVVSVHIPYRGVGGDEKYIRRNDNWRNPYLEGELRQKVIRRIVHGIQ